MALDLLAPRWLAVSDEFILVHMLGRRKKRVLIETLSSVVGYKYTASPDAVQVHPSNDTLTVGRAGTVEDRPL